MAAGATTVSITPYTVDTASKIATPVMRACNSFDDTFTLVAVEKGKNALPDFITHDGNGVLTVTPLDDTDMGVWDIEVTQDPVNGVTVTWDAVRITVGCVVTSITAQAPPDPSVVTLTYALYATPLLIDLKAWTYTQAPSCGYTFTHSYSWLPIPAAAVDYIQPSVPVPQAITV